MPAVNNVGEPCAGESHARFDGRVLETELLPTRPSSARQPPRQRSTLRNYVLQSRNVIWGCPKRGRMRYSRIQSSHHAHHRGSTVLAARIARFSPFRKALP